MFKITLTAFLLLIAGAAAAEDSGDEITNCLVRPKQVAQLGSQIFGVLVDVSVDRGDVVEKGQVVARLDSSVEEAQLALDRYRASNTMDVETAQLALQFDQRELERRRQLAANMFVKASDIDEFSTKVDQDRVAIRKAEADRKLAALEAERSQRQLVLKQIHSPFSGVVTERKLSPGEYLYEQAPIMTIAQIDPLAIEAVVPIDRYGAFKSGMTIPVNLDAPAARTVTAKVDIVDPVIDPASDTFRIRLILPNPGNAIPAGLRCSLRVPGPASR